WAQASGFHPKLQLTEPNFLIPIRSEPAIPKGKDHPKIFAMMLRRLAVMQVMNMGTDQNRTQPERITHRQRRMVQIHRKHIKKKSGPHAGHHPNRSAVRQNQVKDPQGYASGETSGSIQKKGFQRMLPQGGQRREKAGLVMQAMDPPK